MGRHNTPIHLLERFRQEQRAIRAARLAGQQAGSPAPVHAPPPALDPGRSAANPPEPAQAPGVPADAAAVAKPVRASATPPGEGRPASATPAVGPPTRLAGLVLDADRPPGRVRRATAGPNGTANGMAEAILNGAGGVPVDGTAASTVGGTAVWTAPSMANEAAGGGPAGGRTTGDGAASDTGSAAPDPAVIGADAAGAPPEPADRSEGGGGVQGVEGGNPTAKLALLARSIHREVTVERIRTGVRGLGQALITFGVVVLLFVAYELWVTNMFNNHTQGQLATQLSDTWNRGEDPLSPTVADPEAKVRNLPLGQGIALIRIPALGLDYVRVVVEGTGEASLAEGPGHYVDTALPGELGNFSVAGHRVGKGSPFLDLDRLRAGDAIVVETKTTYYVYRVLGDRRTGNPATPDVRGIPGREIVTPSDTDVITPVPDHPGLAPMGRFLTLTTCHPRFSARQRMIIHAELVDRPWPKSSGIPPVLRG